jgi:hypothetical protein
VGGDGGGGRCLLRRQRRDLARLVGVDRLDAVETRILRRVGHFQRVGAGVERPDIALQRRNVGVMAVEAGVERGRIERHSAAAHALERGNARIEAHVCGLQSGDLAILRHLASFQRGDGVALRHLAGLQSANVGVMPVEPVVDGRRIERHAAAHAFQRGDAGVERAQRIVDAGRVKGAARRRDVGGSDIAIGIGGHHPQRAGLESVAVGDSRHGERLGASPQNDLVRARGCQVRTDNDRTRMSRRGRAGHSDYDGF